MTTTESHARELVAEDEAGFKRGRASMLLGLLAAALLAMIGLWQLLSHGDQARVYGEIGRRINGVRQEQFDEFWACALDGQDPHSVHSNAELRKQLERAADGGGEYAAYLRESCADKLTEIKPELDDLIIPDDLKADVEALKAATGQLEASLGAFIACLSNPGQPCDRSAAKSSLDGIARGWFDFQTAHASINRTLKAKLENR